MRGITFIVVSDNFGNFVLGDRTVIDTNVDATDLIDIASIFKRQFYFSHGRKHFLCHVLT